MEKKHKDLITLIGIIVATGFIFFLMGYVEGIERNHEDTVELQITLSECMLSHANCNKNYVNCVLDKVELINSEVK